MSGASTILRTDLQPIFKAKAAEAAKDPMRGDANRILAPLRPPVSRLAVQAIVATGDNIMSDTAGARDITKPIDMEAPVEGPIREIFSTTTANLKKYGPGEVVITDIVRKNYEDQGLDYEAIMVDRLAKRADDIHYAAVFDALQTSGNYLDAATAVGSLADRSLGIGKKIEDAMELAELTNGGVLTHMVVNRKQLYLLSQMFDVSGRGRTAIAKAATEDAQTLGYENPNRFANWLLENFGLTLVVDRRRRSLAGTKRRFLANTAMCLVGVEPSPAAGAGFLATLPFAIAGIPASETDLGAIISYAKDNPRGTAYYAELVFSLLALAETGGKSPNGVLLSCTV